MTKLIVVQSLDMPPQTVIERQKVLLHPMNTWDASAVRDLLRDIGKWYPGGEQWLDRVLSRYEQGNRRITIALAGDFLAGVTIESRKPGRAIKLSTIFVGQAFRQQGVASALLRNLHAAWQQDSADGCYVTISEPRPDNLAKVLMKAGFAATAQVPGRYTPGKVEVIYRWSKDSGRRFK